MSTSAPVEATEKAQKTTSASKAAPESHPSAAPTRATERAEGRPSTPTRPTERPEGRSSAAPSRTAEPAEGRSSEKPAQDKEPEDRVEREEADDEPRGNPMGGLIDGLKSWAGDTVDRFQDRVKSVERQQARDWKNPQDALQNLKKNQDLSTYSSQQLLKLDGLAQVNSRVRGEIRGQVAEFVSRSGSLEALPENRGFQSLLKHQVVDYKRAGNPLLNMFQAPDKVQKAQQHLDKLVQDRVESTLAGQMEGREGDSEAESALRDWGGDLTALAERNPALAEKIQNSARGLAGSDQTEEKLNSIAEADDTLWDDARGVMGDVAGEVVDQIPILGSTFPGSNLLEKVPVVGEGVKSVDEARSKLLSQGGDWLGDRAKDLLMTDGSLGPDSALGSGIELLGGDGEKFEHDLRGGTGNLADSTIDGVTGGLADPSATAQGGVEMLMHLPNPARIVLEGKSMGEQAEKDAPFWDAVSQAATEPYRESFQEYGTVGGLTHVLGDAALTIGLGGGEGAAIKGLQAARFTRAARVGREMQELTSLSTALPRLQSLGDGEAVAALTWASKFADRYQSINDPARRTVGKTRGSVSSGAETAGEQEEQ